MCQNPKQQKQQQQQQSKNNQQQQQQQQSKNNQQQQQQQQTQQRLKLSPPRPRLLYGSIAIWVAVTGGRFLASFLEHEAGFSDTYIGITAALRSALTSCTSLVAGSIADSLERRYPNCGRLLVVLCGVLVGTALFLLHGSHYIFGDEGLFTNPFWHITIQSLYACCTACVLPVLDGFTIDVLKQEKKNDGNDDNKSNFGQERLYGAVWWAIANIILGPSFDKFNFFISYHYSIIAAAIVCITMFIYVRGQPFYYGDMAAKHSAGYTYSRIEGYIASEKSAEMAQFKGKKDLSEQFTSISSDVENSNVKASESIHEDCCRDERNDNIVPVKVEQIKSNDDPLVASTSILDLLRIVLATMNGMAFVFAIFCLYSGTAVVEGLVFLYFEFLGGTNTICAFTVLMTVIFEIPIFQIAPNLLRRYGPSTLLIVAGCAYVIRVTGYTLIPDGSSIYVLFLEPLHGITYAMAKTSTVEYIARVTPPGYDASGQSLVFFIQGMGSIFGLLIAGIIGDKFGPRPMYRFFATVVTIGMLVFAVVITFGSNSQATTTTARAKQTTSERLINDDVINHNDDDEKNDTLKSYEHTIDQSSNNN